jgi:ATP-dependent DNA helicase RecG
MKPSLDKLQKFLKLEAERGYDNRAVVGGLERILGMWEAEARAESLPEDLIQLVGERLRSYASLSPTSRSELLEGLWKRIQRTSGENLASLPTRTPAETESEKPTTKPESIPALTAPARPPRPVTREESTPRSSSPPRSIKPILAAEGQPAALNAAITVLQGIGPRHSQTLSRLGLNTLGDLLYFFPRRYVDYSQLKPINRLWYGEVVTVMGMLESVANRPIRGGKIQVTEAVVTDGSGALRVTWFNQPWIGKRLSKGMLVSLSGKIEQYLGRLVMNNPELEQLDQEHLNTNRIVPVYSLTANITQRWLRGIMHQVITYWAPRVQDPLPDQMRESAELMDLQNAILHVHFPESNEALEAARHRLAFDEIFMLQLGVLGQKRAWEERTARTYQVNAEWLESQIKQLPFTLTQAQKRAIQDVVDDLAEGHPMNRLLQGDVGSGKTIIAAMAAAMMAQHGVQTALMAPTSILAEQHYKNLVRLFSQENPADEVEEEGVIQPVMQADQIRLMIGATPEAEKRQIRDGLADGTIKLIIGTHALIEDPVTFADLQLTIVDEQHRFGVQQRAALRSKGDNPHLMVMTATPIPRSLALTVYGDLDLSILDEMPPGRQPVQTQVFLPRERERAYSLIRSQLELGHQAFIIYPLVEESENSESKAAVEEHTRLQENIFPKYKLGLLHGRMSADDKDEVMSRFRDCQLDILVSTSVVEVGVDVPNATVMLIEGANRFGLAQLHQFRGRVGRGQDQAYCILIPETADAAENERLAAMVETNDGFILAERDLEQRGPGDFLGTRQSGYQTELRLASLTDIHIIDKARRLAQEIFGKDPKLEAPEHQLVAGALGRFWGEGQGDIS